MSKKLTTIISVSLLCGFVFNINAQNYIKLDASFYSEVLDEVKNIDIYLPADYYIYLDQYYATIYYLHGAAGNQNAGNTDAMWYYNQHAQDTAISSPPAIFVCPDGSCEPFTGSWYLNSELFGNYEDYIMQDVIGFMESNFRVKADKNFRFITGFSMGGFGSGWLGVNYPDKFRACLPFSGFLAQPDTFMNVWRNACYEENGSYNLNYNAGGATQVYFTMCGGMSPNMGIEPYHIEIPFDTSGNWVDTVLNKWHQYDQSRYVKNLPDENELAWFLGCGTTDYMITYPTYQVFMDSLDFYGIAYDYSYFDGGHGFDPESWIMAIHWMDSIIDVSYQTLGISIYREALGNFNVFPNPARDQLTFSYQLNEAGTAELNIFNIDGQLIETVSNEFKPAGEYRFVRNISDYTPGIYFCRLQIGNQIITKKIIKAK